MSISKKYIHATTLMEGEESKIMAAGWSAAREKLNTELRNCKSEFGGIFPNRTKKLRFEKCKFEAQVKALRAGISLEKSKIGECGDDTKCRGYIERHIGGLIRQIESVQNRIVFIDTQIEVEKNRKNK